MGECTVYITKKLVSLQIRGGEYDQNHDILLHSNDIHHNAVICAFNEVFMISKILVP